MNKRLIGLIGLAWAGVASGCALSPEDDRTATTEDPVYTETHVVLHGNDAPEIFVRPVRLSEQKRALAEFQRGKTEVAPGLGSTKQAISTTGCSFGVLEFWTNGDYTGETICFTGTGTATLASYPRTGGNWSTGKKSFFTGPWNGRLQRSIDCSTYFYFSSAELYGDMVACNQNAPYLIIDS